MERTSATDFEFRRVGVLTWFFESANWLLDLMDGSISNSQLRLGWGGPEQYDEQDGDPHDHCKTYQSDSHVSSSDLTSPLQCDSGQQ